MTCTTPTQKVCTICKLPTDTNQFAKHGGHKDGLGSNCRDCVKELARMRRLNIPRTPKPPKIKTPKLPKAKIVVPIDPGETDRQYQKRMLSRIAAAATRTSATSLRE